MSRTEILKIAGVVIAGVLLWLIAQMIAVGLAGGGEGWDGPAILSSALLVLYPLTFVRVVRWRHHARLDAALLIVAAMLDGFLCYNIRIQEPGYFAMADDVAPGAASAWFVLWLGWQVVAAGAFVRAVSRNRARLPNGN